MKKMFLIGFKDLKLAFRDRTALMMMLLAPFLLTLGLGFVTGRFSDSGSTVISGIPIILANQDKGQLGGVFASVFGSSDLKELVSLTQMTDPALARQQVDANQADAAIIIPSGFTESALAARTKAAIASGIKIELYANPTHPTNVGVIKSILDQFLSQVELRQIGGQVIAAQLASRSLIPTQDLAQASQKISVQLENSSGSAPVISVNQTINETTSEFDPLAIIAPGMALMFLMWTASYGGRALLNERTQGTLPRLLVSPTTVPQVLGGKIIGTFLTGVAQVSILILATTLIFHLAWGDPIGLFTLVMTAVFASVGWGMLITTIAKTPTQISNIGATVMLMFGLLGGTFFSLQNTPAWLQLASKITPNAWGLDGFTALAMGGNFGDALTPILALLAMGAILFGLAVALFNRSEIAER
jgi:ABC-2 type transport system permease protein